MADPYRLEPANVSGAGIVFGVFAALVTQLMLGLLIVGLGLSAADTATVGGEHLKRPGPRPGPPSPAGRLPES